MSLTHLTCSFIVYYISSFIMAEVWDGESYLPSLPVIFDLFWNWEGGVAGVPSGSRPGAVGRDGAPPGFTPGGAVTTWAGSYLPVGAAWRTRRTSRGWTAHNASLENPPAGARATAANPAGKGCHTSRRSGRKKSGCDRACSDNSGWRPDSRWPAGPARIAPGRPGNYRPWP